MIFVGSGAIHARDEILELAELIDAPVVAFRSGRGIVTNAHELGLTMAAAYRLWPKYRSHDRDRYAAWNCRPRSFRWPFRPEGLKSIRIDIDPSEMRRFTPDTAVVADAKAGTAICSRRCRKAGYKKTSGRRAAIREASAAALQEIQKVQPQMAYLNILREVLPHNAIVTDELSQVGFASWYGFPVYEPRTFITSGYQGTLGSGFPTALGAKVANPDRPVVAITGDGGFMFGVQELATAVQFNIGVVTLVFNNNAYGNVRRDQRERFDGRVVASDLVNPDFVKLAESFGVRRGARDIARDISPGAGKGAGAWRALSDRRRGAEGFRDQAVDLHPSGESRSCPPGTRQLARLRRRRLRANRNSGSLCRCAIAHLRLGPGGRILGMRGQSKPRARSRMPCWARDAAITSRPAPATDQHATGAQCNSGAYSGSFCRPPATAAIRAKVASASAENTRPTTLPSAPLSPIARAAEIALISMQPQAAPAMNCAAINVLRFPAKLRAENGQCAQQTGGAHHDQSTAVFGD